MREMLNSARRLNYSGRLVRCCCTLTACKPVHGGGSVSSQLIAALAALTLVCCQERDVLVSWQYPGYLDVLLHYAHWALKLDVSCWQHMICYTYSTREGNDVLGAYITLI